MSVTALSSSGQYQFLLKGQPSPFDTAVAVRIDRYRIEGKKMKLAGVLVDSLGLEIKGLRREVSFSDSLNRISIQQNLLLTNTVIRKDSVITTLHAGINTIAEDPPGPKFDLKNFIKKPEGIGLSVLLAIEVIRLIAGK